MHGPLIFSCIQFFVICFYAQATISCGVLYLCLLSVQLPIFVKLRIYAYVPVLYDSFDTEYMTIFNIC